MMKLGETKRRMTSLPIKKKTTLKIAYSSLHTERVTVVEREVIR